MTSPLVRLIGFPATVLHGDTLVLDRWRWLRQHLPVDRDQKCKVLDVGCGSGAFTIGAALRGYEALGLSWDARNKRVAEERAELCGASGAKFSILDVRRLDDATELIGEFDIIICCENIEHIIDDKKLMRDMAACLKQNGRLLLTTPFSGYRPMTIHDEGPFSKSEDGGHVRRGYTHSEMRDLCDQAGLSVIEVGYCSWIVSQKITAVIRTVSRLNPIVAWAITFPLRILPMCVDPALSYLVRWPGFSITMVAVKE